MEEKNFSVIYTLKKVLKLQKDEPLNHVLTVKVKLGKNSIIVGQLGFLSDKF